MLRLTLTLALVAHAISGADAWARTKCGPGDLVTEWGMQITPASLNNVLQEYPRPQLSRESYTQHKVLNGLWQYQFGTGAAEPPPFNQPLQQEILVPFPPEACLSGIGATPPKHYSWYRLLVDSPFPSSGGRTLLHFGAVDWNSTVFVNQQLVGTHSGGYSRISHDVTAAWKPSNNEIIVWVYDPSDAGEQVNGKQRISAMTDPGGDTYTPSSGIWQTVWLEQVPTSYVRYVKTVPGSGSVLFNVSMGDPSAPSASVTINVYSNGVQVASGTGASGSGINIAIPSPQLWNIGAPFLYNATIQACIAGTCDTVDTYFGLRVVGMSTYTLPGTPMTGPQMGVDRGGGDLPGSPFALNTSDPNVCWGMCNKTAGCTAWAYAIPGCDGFAQPTCWLKGIHPGTSAQKCRVSGDQGTAPGGIGRRPTINNKFTFLAGWLDQSFFPDGLYTAPSDEALVFDVKSVLEFGLNSVRLHQKVNSDRWYYAADKLGIAIQQDMIQKYGGATAATVPLFMNEIQMMIDDLYNHPSIFMWTVFNEGDCVALFNASKTAAWVKAYDPTRLVDTNSGGPANDLLVQDSNDIHSYPYPGHPLPSATQFAEVGEYFGVGIPHNPGREWVPEQCQAYMQVPDAAAMLQTYVDMTKTVIGWSGDISQVVFTQLSDLERECDGFLDYARTNKLNATQMATMFAANQAMIAAASDRE